MVYDFCVVFITVPKGKEARILARRLLQTRCAACINIVSTVASLYWWNGHIDEAKEGLLIVKIHRSKLKTLLYTVQKNHSYKVPEIIALPIVGGYKPYLNWVKKETRPAKLRG